MEIAGDAAPSGGRSIRDLPPSKRFKFVGSILGSASCVALPAKKRAFPPPLPEAAPFPVCLPAKKRAYAAAVAEEAAAKVCLPAKKRAYAPTVDAVSPACLPAKTSVHVQPPPTPEVVAPPPTVPSEKSVQAPSRRDGVDAPISVPAKKRVQMQSRPVVDTAAPSVPPKKRVLTLSPLRNAGAPPTVPAKKRLEGAAAPMSVLAKKLFQVPPRTEAATAAPSVQTKKRIQAPLPTDGAAAPPSAPAKNLVQVLPRTEAAMAAPSVQAKKRVQAPSAMEDAAAPPSVPAKQRVPVPSCPERAVAAPSVPAKKRVLVPSRPDGTTAAVLPVTASKRVPSPSAQEDASALFPVCLPANKRVMSQFIPPSLSPSMKSDGDRVAAAKEARPKGSVKRSGATNSSVANCATDCPRAEASKMPDGDKPKEVKDLVFAKSRRANTAKKASDVHCKKLSDVISGMQSEVQAEVLKTLEQTSDVHCKKPSNVVGGEHSEVQAEELKTVQQASDVHCKKPSNVVDGKHSEVQAEEEKASDLHCKKLSDGVDDKLSEAQEEVLKTLEQASDVHCRKLCNVVNGKHSEVQEEVLKTLEQAIDPKGAAQAREVEPKKEAEVVPEPAQHALVEEEEDDGILCAVCRSTDGDPSDPIVFCDGCDLMVHAACYGSPLAQSIPEGDWFCSLCSDKAAKKGKPARPPCRLCPARGGAMKRTTDGAWAHISCALLVPEVFFQDPDGRDAIDCSLVPGRRFTKPCYICESSRGCALECSQPKCDLGFHVSCGLNGGLCIEYREEKGGGVVAGFCREHSILWEKQQLTGKYKIVSRKH
uniref:Uncharacterized protein n=1 Tax=Avena sativa TaxID=4498 RepID=A0ACD5VUG1_AVESA